MKHLKIGLSCLLILIVFSSLQAQHSYDEFSSTNKDNNLGTYVFYKMINDLFEGEIKKSEKEVLDHFAEEDEVNTDVNFISISKDFGLNSKNLRRLVSFVQNGGYCFIASYQFPMIMMDTLEIDIGFTDENYDVNFTDESLRAQSPYSLSQLSNIYFDNYREDYTEVLGVNGNGEPTLIRINVGEGAFILSTTPNAFTNDNMLDPTNYKYIEGCMAYLPEKNKVLWDEYHKYPHFDQQQHQNKMNSPNRLDVINKNPSLKWAFWLTVALLLAFVIFEIRRKQRIIPVIKPMTNDTVEFVKTIAGIYYEKGDDTDIAQKKAKFFMELLRRKFHIQISEPREDLVPKVAEKTKVPIQEVRSLFEMLRYILGGGEVDQNMLINFNDQTESFMEKST